MEQKREVDSRRMIAVIEETLCHVHSGNPRRLVFQAIEDKLVFADANYRKLIVILKRLFDIVCIQNRQRTNFLYIFLAKRKNIGKCTDDDQKVAEESTDMVVPDRILLCGGGVLHLISAVLEHHMRLGQERFQSCPHSHGT